MYKGHFIRFPLVSIVIPVFNTEDYIGDAIESALAQSYPSIEIIVVDDGSTDDSAKMVERYQRRHSHIQLIQQSNQGVASARNAAVAISRGQYVAPLDADDIWLKEKISEQVKAMEASPEKVGLVYAWSATIDSIGRYSGGVHASRQHNDVFADLLFGNMVGNGSTPLIRRNCFDAIGDYSDEFLRRNATGCEDRDLYLRIAEKFDYAVVPRILVGYRQLPNSMSSDAVAMGRSHDLMIDRLRRRNQQLPRRFLLQSSAFNRLYLANTESRRGRYIASAIQLARAAILDPNLLTETGYYRLLRTRLIQLISRLLRVVWPKRKRLFLNSEGKRQNDVDIAALEARVAESIPGWLEERKLRRADSVRVWAHKNAYALTSIRNHGN